MWSFGPTERKNGHATGETKCGRNVVPKVRPNLVRINVIPEARPNAVPIR